MSEPSPEIKKTPFGVLFNYLSYYSASWLAESRFERLPTSRAGIYKLADRESWEFINVPGQGAKDGVKYFRVPDYVQRLIQERNDIIKFGRPMSDGNIDESGNEPDEQNTIYIDHYVDVRGSAGPGAEVFQEEVVVKARIDGRLLRERVGNGFASIKLITVSGDSMEPTLLHGDQVMVDTSCMDFVDDAIYAIQQGGHLRIKRIKLKLDGSIIVSSDNSTHNGPETYSADEAQHFKVVGKIIPFKFGRFKV